MFSSASSLLPLVPLLAVLPTALALDDAGMRSRSVYQLITDRFARPSSATSTCNASDRKYCGGTWSAIADKLDYISGMGYDTVWISPVVENIGGTTGLGEAYHGYWTLDINNLNSNFGTADDLKSLSTKLHDKNMYLMVDVVVNHVAATAGSSFTPDANYAPFDTSADYHSFCWIQDYTNQTQVEVCWLGDDQVALVDINTNSDEIKSTWNNWIKSLVSNYTLDAVRIDTVKHVQMDFWPNFTSSAGVFNQGEVLNGDASYNALYQKDGNVNPFNYPAYYPLTRAFNQTSGDLASLVTMASTIKSSFEDPTLLGNFLNNHDNPRFESTVTDTSLIKNAHAYPFVTDGIPYGYYGSEAGFTGGNDPDNREPLWTANYDTSSDMYKFFASLNAVRKAAGSASSDFYTNQMSVSSLSDSSILVVKGPLVSVLSNSGSSASDASVTVPSSSSNWSANTKVIDAISCESLTTDGSGNLAVTVKSGLPRVFIADSSKGSSVCSNSTSSSSGGNSGATSVIASSPRTLVAGTVGAALMVLAMAF
ncbi:alpha-amylase [Kwoniella heveanensis CBS 569]|uniref:alpha-amylase n=1 Tax=Kwoniella heveanensis BCC8398 TaxID=1296120 RepID=A0A1B9H3U4_9TREE|nr:alpha-amylase [Kwoniella heveanensis BCC8398]OCF39974.1 alpha-amylase [Kwoniella heveanensis CBS 569]